jgi:hypothetical protein
MGIAEALEMGRKLQMRLPASIRIFGIGVEKKGEIGQAMDRTLEERIPAITQDLAVLVRQQCHNSSIPE